MLARPLGFLLAGLIAAVLLAELVLRALPIPAGIAAADPVPGWPAHRLVPNSRFTSSSGWALENVQRGTINNAGYIAPFDYRDGAHVGVVIGDSFVEGYMNPYPTMLQARLAHDLGLPADQVYNFGSSGASLPHYLGVARLAGARYQPRWAVVLVTKGDVVEGFGSAPGFFRWDDGPDLIRIVPERRRGRMAKMARDLAVLRYARGNLKLSAATLFASGFASERATRCVPARLEAADRRLLARWLAALPTALSLPPQRVVLVFDGEHPAPVAAAAAPPPACPDRDDVARAWLRREADAAGIRTVATAPIFAAAVARDHRPIDRAPLDGHWNPHGHALVAHAVALALATGTPTDRAHDQGSSSDASP